MRLDEAGKWSPREDFNLHYRVRSPAVCALAYEGNGRRPRNRTATSSFGGSSSTWSRLEDSNPHGVAALSRFERGALPVGLALQ